MNCVRYIKSELLEKWLYTGRVTVVSVALKISETFTLNSILIPLWQWFMDFFLENNNLGCALVKLLH